MPETNIDRLQIEINAESNQAAKGIDRLVSSLERLSSATSGGISGVSRVSNDLNVLNLSLTNMKGKGNNLTRVTNSLSKLSTINLSSAIGNISQFVGSAERLSTVGNSLQSIRDFGKGITSLNTSFNKLQKMDFDRVATDVRTLASALKPLTDEMMRGGPYVLAYGNSVKQLAQSMRTVNNIGKLTNQMAKSTNELNSTLSSVRGLASFATGLYALREGAQYVYGFIQNINSYVEDINLFTVAMGSAAEEAENFTQKMQTVLGIDAGEAMRNMGIFNQLATSFGVSSDQAEILSKNFTQLAYDLSSFFNLPIEESFEKLQSGLAGEIEPLNLAA